MDSVLPPVWVYILYLLGSQTVMLPAYCDIPLELRWKLPNPTASSPQQVHPIVRTPDAGLKNTGRVFQRPIVVNRWQQRAHVGSALARLSVDISSLVRFESSPVQLPQTGPMRQRLPE